MVVLEPEVAAIEDGLWHGVTVGLDGFLATLAKDGARLVNPGEALTADALGARIAALEGKRRMTRAQARLEFVAALGRERMQRLHRTAKGVWGEARLDPFQLVVLGRAFLPGAGAGAHHALAAPVETSLAPRRATRRSSWASACSAPAALAGEVGAKAVNWKKFFEWVEEQSADEAKDKLADKAADVLGVPTDSKDAAFASLCASLVLYGYKLDVDADPSLVWREQKDDPSKKHVSKVSAKLEFRDDYKKIKLRGTGGGEIVDMQELMSDAGCPLPNRGPVPNRALEWELSEPLQEHGEFDLESGDHTDWAGKALQTYRTKEEETPRAFRKFRRESV